MTLIHQEIPDRASGNSRSGKSFRPISHQTIADRLLVLTAGTINEDDGSEPGQNHNFHFSREEAIGSRDQISSRSTVAFPRTHDGVSSLP